MASIKPIYFSRLSTPQSSLSNCLLISRKTAAKINPSSLSLPTLQTTFPCSNNPTNPCPKASTGKRSSTAGTSAQRSTKVRQSLLPTVFSSETTAILAPQSGMGFESLLPLAIASVPFRFLKSLDLSSLGLGLDAVPSCFWWELIE